MSSKCKGSAHVEAFATPAKQTCDATKHQLLKFEAELSINSSNSFSRLDSLEDRGVPDPIVKWSNDVDVKQFNHAAERELVFCEFIGFNFLR